MLVQRSAIGGMGYAEELQVPSSLCISSQVKSVAEPERVSLLDFLSVSSKLTAHHDHKPSVQEQEGPVDPRKST